MTILILVLLSQFSYGQITTTKVVEKNDKISTELYDSLQNFLGTEVSKYLGQEFYLKGKAEGLRKYGYDGFYVDYNKSKFDNGVYKCCDSYNSKYDELNGKYFKVLEIIKHPKASESEYLYGKKSYLKLEEKVSKDIVYFEYDSQFEHSFPFIVVGFFEKVKKIVVGQNFVVANNVFESSTDILTGDSIINTPNQRWECTDLTIEEKYYTLSLVVKNPHGQSTTISYDSIFGKFNKGKFYSEKDANEYEQKFGKTNWLKILDGKVVIGFTEEMVLLSWGEPDKINRASYGDQWVYDGEYLYFENGKMKSFN